MSRRETINLHSMAPDLIPEDAPAEVWTGAQNVVFRNGETVAAGADSSVYAVASITPKTIVYVEPFDSGFWVYADENSIMVTDGTNEFDITPVSWVTTGVDPIYTSTVINGLACVNVNDRDPVYWDGNTSNVCEPLPDWPDGGTCLALRGHGNFLMAVGMTSEGGQRVRWSSAAAAGEIPDSWTPLASNQAGFVDLAPLSSDCLDGLTMHDDFLVYKRESIWRFVFVGGNDIFDVSQAFAEYGCASTNGIGRGPNDNHLFITSAGDIAITNGITVDSVLSGRAQRVFYDDFQEVKGADYSVFTLMREKLGGVIYPTNGSLTGMRILLFDYDSGDISFRDVDNALCSASGRFLEDVGDRNTWDGDPEAWDLDPTAWNQSISPATVEDVLIGSTSGFLLLGGSDTALPVSLEKEGLAFGNPKFRKQIDRIWPKMVGTTADVIQFRLGSQETSGGPVSLGPTLDYEIGSGLSIDTFWQGRFLSIYVESGSATDVSSWRLGSFDLEFREVGRW